MTVLVVDNDHTVRSALPRALAFAGYDVQSFADGELAVRVIAQSSPEAVLLDAGPAGIDGLEMCRRLRRQGSRTPVLMMTASASVAARIDALDAGADDCIVKPFEVGELRARLRALLRRRTMADDVEPLAFGDVRLERDRHGVSVGGHFAQLTRMEYRLLELFLRNPGTVLPRGVIYERVWGYDFGAASNALRVYISYLRRKLERLGARELIHTVRGVGYVMSEPERIGARAYRRARQKVAEPG